MKGGSSSTSGSGSSSSIYSSKAESIRSFDGSSESKSSNSSSSRKADKESKREPSRDSRDGGERRRDRVSEQAAYFRDEGRPESIAESKYEIWEENRADAREQLRKKRTTGRRE